MEIINCCYYSKNGGPVYLKTTKRTFYRENNWQLLWESEDEATVQSTMIFNGNGIRVLLGELPFALTSDHDLKQRLLSHMSNYISMYYDCHKYTKGTYNQES